MSNQVDQYAKPEPRDRFHPEYDSFREWLDAEAPPTEQVLKRHNQPRYRNPSAVTLDALVGNR